MSSLSRALADLGPAFRATETLVTQQTAQATIALCGSDPARWLLWIVPPQTNNEIFVAALATATILAGGGLPLGTSGGTGVSVADSLSLWFRQHAILAQQAWFGGLAAGRLPLSTQTWTVYEVLFVPG